MLHQSRLYTSIEQQKTLAALFFRAAHNYRRCAFTLTELLAVICILGLIASASMFTLSSAIRRAERNTSLETLKSLIQWSRDRSRIEPVELQLDFGKQTLLASAPRSNQSRQHLLKGDLQLVEASLRGVQRDQGSLRIDFSQGGCSTFAVRLKSGSTTISRDQWLVICGPTGEVLQYEHTPELAKSLGKWLAQWAHLN